MTSLLSPTEMIQARKVIITCGTGGVGKTTISAALALKAAKMGKRALVITVDPARRLATSLGVEELSETPMDLSSKVEGLKPDRFYAVMPKSQSSMESFIIKLAKYPELSKKIIASPIFQMISGEFSGSQEYMALERLYAFIQTGEWDLIVLDTPPSRNTLAFLDAPERLQAFLEERVLRWLNLPGGRLLSLGLQKALGLLEQLTGSDFIPELINFATQLIEIKEPFTQKLKKIQECLRLPTTGFVMILGPSPDLMPDIGHFVATIRQKDLVMDGFILNRLLPITLDTAQKESTDPALMLLKYLKDREVQFEKKLTETIPFIPIIQRIPEMSRDIHSLEALCHVAKIL